MAHVGRPAVPVRFRANLGHVAGVDIGAHRISAVVADLAGTAVGECRVVPRPGASGATLIELVRECLVRASADAATEAAALWAVCVGTPGIVDQTSGEVVLSPSLPGLQGAALATELRAWLGGSVMVDNDVNFSVIAERERGEASDNLLFVHWGERIGSGIAINGRLYRGTSCAAGELGHIDLTSPIDEPPRVSDGFGPFERDVAAGAIHRLALDRCTGALRDRLAASTDLAPLFEAAERGQADALEVVDLVARRFARGLATMLLILDPERVIVGGGVSRAGPVLFDALRRHLGRLLLVPVDVRASDLGDKGVVLGAVRVALDRAEERLAGMV
jgi:predicted NBD/HSP70 family sugar kinase